MYIPKRYGQSKTETCPFCQKLALAKNRQGLNVCTDHTKNEMPEIRCACGSWLELKSGKWGPYFYCMNCGNINLKKGLELAENTGEKQKKAPVDKRHGEDKFILDPGKYPGFDYGLD